MKWNGDDSKNMLFWNKIVNKWEEMTKDKRNLPEDTLLLPFIETLIW